MTDTTQSPPTRPLWRRILRKLLILCVIFLALGVAAGIWFFRYSHSFDKLVAEKFPHQRYHSRIYSASYPLVEGTPIAASGIISRLNVRNYKSVATRPKIPGEYHKISESTLQIFVRGYDLPQRKGARGLLQLSFQSSILTKITVLEGSPQSEYALEPLLLKEVLGRPKPPPVRTPAATSSIVVTPSRPKPKEEKADEAIRATFVPLNQIPLLIQNAMIASEDQRFYKHSGVDLVGILRATFTNVLARKQAQGGSTIPQQLAKNGFTSNERSLKRKIEDAAIAMSLKRQFSDEKILETYLNTTDMGRTTLSQNQRGVAIHGFYEAAFAYFNKRMDELSLAEVAFLTQVTQKSTLNSPNSPTIAQDRLPHRNRVIRLMEKLGMVDHAQAEAAIATPIELHVGKYADPKFGYFTSYAENVLQKTLGANYMHEGLTIYTTVEPALQDYIEKSISEELNKIQRVADQHTPFQRGKPALQGAVVLMDYSNGKMLAMVGGRNVKNPQQNRAFQSGRQPGSAIKGITYAAAFETLPDFNPATTVADTKKTWPDREGHDWTPKNDRRDFHPQISVAKAFALSQNIVAVRVAIDMAKLPQVVATATRLGLDPMDPTLPSIALGAVGVPLYKLAGAYAAFANNGLQTQPQPIDLVLDQKGNALFSWKKPTIQAVKPETSHIMMELLKTVPRYGTAWGMTHELVETPYPDKYYPFPSAGKTGTSQDETDGTYISILPPTPSKPNDKRPLPNYLLAAWTGHDNDRGVRFRLGLAAADTAVPFAGRLLRGEIMGPHPKIDFVRPDDIVERYIDGYSGGSQTKSCPRHVLLPVGFLKTTKSPAPCPLKPEEHQEKRVRIAKDPAETP